MTAKAKRQSKEAQRNERAQRVYQGIRYLGIHGEHPNLEEWSAPSASDAETMYTVSRDRATHLMHCNCPAGQHERATCVHRDAVSRWIAERETRHETPRETRRTLPGDTALMARSNRPFSLLA